mmetsp:Transcript_15238/g.38246  ORF Transcript_15238/g.38246 Transcript_15238/m.38246 type:complete len:206 (-) Transcript_15238:29-646(-)
MAGRGAKRLGHVTDAHHKRRVEQGGRRGALQADLDRPHVRHLAGQRVLAVRSGVHLPLGIPLDHHAAVAACCHRGVLVREPGLPEHLEEALLVEVEGEHPRLVPVLEHRPPAAVRHPHRARLDPRHAGVRPRARPVRGAEGVRGDGRLGDRGVVGLVDPNGVTIVDGAYLSELGSRGHRVVLLWFVAARGLRLPRFIVLDTYEEL